jgi:hypothetical protein
MKKVQIYELFLQFENDVVIKPDYSKINIPMRYSNA